MTITLPDEMRGELERKAKAAGFASVVEYLAWLVKTDDTGDDNLSPEDLGFANQTELETKLLASLASGPPVLATPEFWEERRRRAAERAATRRDASDSPPKPPGS